MEQDIRNGLADQSTKTDYATLRHWLGAQEGVPLSRDQQEKFARGFELYLREGKAPSRELESVFARFKKWLTQIYKQATQLNVEMTDEVRGVFDRMLASDAQINTQTADFMAREEAHALPETENLFWNSVGGRLDGPTLERNYPEAYQELFRRHGPELFKQGGLTPDALAEELIATGHLPKGSGADELMQWLKQGKKTEREFFQDKVALRVSINAVRRQYEGTAAWLVAPRGEPTSLTEEQWLFARTPEFKDCFGDWEVGAAWNFAMDGDPVASILGNEFASDGVPLTDKVTNFYKGQYGGVVVNRILGSVHIDKDGVKASLGHGMGRQKAAAYAAVPEIIRNGVTYGQTTNWKNRGYGTAVIIAPIDMGGVRYIGEVVVTRRPNKTGFYLHEVTIKKGLLEEFKTSIKGSPPKARLIIVQHFEEIKRTANKLSSHGEPNAKTIESFLRANTL